MHKQRSKKEILADLMVQSLNKPRSAEDVLKIGKQIKSDRNIQLGHNIAHGLDMIELMLYWEVTDEDLIDFSKKHEEFVSMYESDNKEHREEILDLFKQLTERTGFNPLTGKVEDGKQLEGTNKVAEV